MYVMDMLEFFECMPTLPDPPQNSLLLLASIQPQLNNKACQTTSSLNPSPQYVYTQWCSSFFFSQQIFQPCHAVLCASCSVSLFFLCPSLAQSRLLHNCTVAWLSGTLSLTPAMSEVCPGSLLNVNTQNIDTRAHWHTKWASVLN